MSTHLADWSLVTEPKMSSRRWVATPILLALLLGCGSTDDDADTDGQPSEAAAEAPADDDDAVGGEPEAATSEPTEPEPESDSSETVTEAPDHTTAQPSGEPVDIAENIQILEEEYDAVVGVYAVNVETGTIAAYQDDERFAYASTIKALAAGAVLAELPDTELNEVVNFSADDLVTYSPITEQHVDSGMTMHEIIDAAVIYSDNTAGNLLFEALGGPEGLQAALTALGDEITVVSRWEPELNEYAPGDDRDTTTAETLVTTLGHYVIGDALEEEQRVVLLDSMRGGVTGDDTIRAGVPEGWVVANKTGSGEHGTRNDVATIWPAEGSDVAEPILLAVLTRTRDADGERNDALLADVTTVVVDALDVS